MRDERRFDQWSRLQCSDVEVVRAHMGPCGLAEHFHDKWSIGLILNGVCRFNSGERQYRVTPSEIFIIPPYEVHVCAAASSNVMYQVMYVSDDMLATAAPHLRRLVSGSGVRVKRLPASLIHQLKQIGGNGEDEMLLNTAMRRLDRVFAKESRSCLPKPHHPLQNALHRHWDQAIDLGKIEQATRYSRWHAIHTFRQQIGLSPRLYLRQLRALKARHLLEQGRPLAEVADALHFSDQAHFSRVFKSVFGVSPGSLQRVMREKPAK